MLRTALVGLALTLTSVGVRADEEVPKPREAQAIEEAFQAAIKKTEPAIVCVLVSRSDAYRRWFGEPAGDDPCKLGDFAPSRAVLRVPAEDQRLYNELRKSLDKGGPRGVPRENHDDVKRTFDLADPSYVPESYGSGVVIAESGLVLTNYHVIRGASKIYVRLAGGKGSYADIHAAEPRCDLAVLRLLDRTLPPLTALKRGDGGQLQKGQIVLSLANPFAAGMKDGSASASWGIVSNLRRRAAPNGATETERAKIKLHHFETLIQTDCRLNVGCSGGALLNLKGELIGLTTAIAAVAGSDVPGGFAIPMDANNRGYVDRLEKGLPVEFGFLGVGFQRGQPGLSVYPGSPAARAGLRDGDHIISVNGSPVADNDDVFLAISTKLAATGVRLEVRSPDGARRNRTAILDKLDVPGQVYASQRPRPVRGLRVDYTSIALQRNPSLQSIPQGVFVSEVEPGSPAENARLRDAIITRVNGEEITGPADFYRRVARMKGPLEFTIINRNAASGVATVKLD